MPHFQVSMDWRCLECRREGTRWFEYEAETVEVPNSSSIKIAYGNQLELGMVAEAPLESPQPS